jgi:hypothetical protein
MNEKRRVEIFSAGWRFLISKKHEAIKDKVFFL